MSTVLLYHFAPEKEGVVRTICQKQGIRCVAVPAARQGCTVGEILRGATPDRAASPPLRTEMLVMDLRGLALDAFLQALQSAGVAVPLKAAVTPTNVAWTPSALARELQRERAAILKK